MLGKYLYLYMSYVSVDLEAQEATFIAKALFGIAVSAS